MEPIHPDEFAAGLRQMFKTFEVLRKLKRPTYMSSSKDFQWTDDLVKEFTSLFYKFPTPDVDRFLGSQLEGFKLFKAKQSNIEENPVPLFTTEDGKEVFKGDEYFAINYKDFIGRPVSYYAFYPHTNMPNLKYFSTEQAANEYIIMNKRCLSVIDCCDLYDVWAFEKKDTWRNALKHLVQSKINTP